MCRHSSSTLFVQFNELGGACGIRMFLYLAGPKRDVYFACVSEGSRCKFVYNGSYWHIPSKIVHESQSYVFHVSLCGSGLIVE